MSSTKWFKSMLSKNFLHMIINENVVVVNADDGEIQTKKFKVDRPYKLFTIKEKVYVAFRLGLLEIKDLDFKLLHDLHLQNVRTLPSGDIVYIDSRLNSICRLEESSSYVLWPCKDKIISMSFDDTEQCYALCRDKSNIGYITNTKTGEILITNLKNPQHLYTILNTCYLLCDNSWGYITQGKYVPEVILPGNIQAFSYNDGYITAILFDEELKIWIYNIADRTQRITLLNTIYDSATEVTDILLISRRRLKLKS